MKTGEYDVQPPSLNEWLRKPENPDAPVDAAPVDAAPVDDEYQDALNIGGDPAEPAEPAEPAPSFVRPTEASTRAGLTPLVQQRLNDAMQTVRQFEPAPEGMSAGEKDLLEYHRGNLRNETYLMGEDGRVSTVYVSGVTGPDERVYNVPGYFNGQRHENEDEIRAQAGKIGWENYPSYVTGEEANAAAQALHKIIDQDTNTPWVQEMLSTPTPTPVPELEPVPEPPKDVAPFPGLMLAADAQEANLVARP